jgi:hypothetical protein
MVTAEIGNVASSVAVTTLRRTRQIHKTCEVNISAYFPAEVNCSLRMLQAKIGCKLEDCLAEALGDLFRVRNVPVAIKLGEGR